MRVIITDFECVVIGGKVYAVIPGQEFDVSKKDAEFLISKNLAVLKETKMFNLKKENKKYG